MNYLKTIINGIFKENPTFVLLLGMCPTLATTTSAINGMGMGVATMFVLICSNAFISLLKDLIPDGIRIPCYIVVIASFVTILQMVMQAYVSDLYNTLG
ncbi:MAG TPA: Rnf-Nqr domain containing protein, partial [Bacteroidaceae bacterium]|nr:Rnf-Nqr domain containing protein [Bacteroidaceae bacterium]